MCSGVSLFIISVYIHLLVFLNTFTHLRNARVYMREKDSFLIVITFIAYVAKTELKCCRRWVWRTNENSVDSAAHNLSIRCFTFDSFIIRTISHFIFFFAIFSGSVGDLIVNDWNQANWVQTPVKAVYVHFSRMASEKARIQLWVTNKTVRALYCSKCSPS